VGLLNSSLTVSSTRFHHMSLRPPAFIAGEYRHGVRASTGSEAICEVPETAPVGANQELTGRFGHTRVSPSRKSSPKAVSHRATPPEFCLNRR
jgi:hypothetical protein